MATKSDKKLENSEKVSLILNILGVTLNSVNPGKKTFLLLTIGAVFILLSVGLFLYFLQSYALPLLASTFGRKLISNLVRIVKAFKSIKSPVKPNTLE